MPKIAVRISEFAPLLRIHFQHDIVERLPRLKQQLVRCLRWDMQDVAGLEHLLFTALDRRPTNLIRGACLSADDLTADYHGCASDLHDSEVRLRLVQFRLAATGLTATF